jgi:hypothetical protein
MNREEREVRAQLAATAGTTPGVEEIRVRDQGAAPMSAAGGGAKLGACLREEEKR